MVRNPQPTHPTKWPYQVSPQTSNGGTRVWKGEASGVHLPTSVTQQDPIILETRLEEVDSRQMGS